MSSTRQYEIEVISPVHIGSGGVTINPIEYVVEDKFYRVDFYKTLLEESNKLSEGTPVILGIEEGAAILKKISDDITELELGKSEYNVERIQMTQMNAEFGPCRENHHYT
jgi:hypothetical protein